MRRRKLTVKKQPDFYSGMIIRCFGFIRTGKYRPMSCQYVSRLQPYE